MKERIITGVLAGSLFLGLLIAGQYWFVALIISLAIIAHFEFMKLNAIHSTSAISILSLLGIVTLVFPWEYAFGFSIRMDLFIWLLMFGLFSITVLTKNKSTIDHAALGLIGSLYIGFGFQTMITARIEHGLFWTAFIFIGIWISDSAAYFSGRAFGKHKLWPTISPKKTIEGAIGGTLFTIIAMIIFAAYGPNEMTAIKAGVIGFIIAVSGMFGDLIESAYKRVRNIKDSGQLLPGHGGVLDRTDSWIIVFPLIALLDLLP